MPRGVRSTTTPTLTAEQYRHFELLTEDPKFKECLDHLTGWRARHALKGQAHPYLGRDDLRQVALMAAFETFARYVNDKRPAGRARTDTTMRRLVVQGMRWALLNEYKRAARSGGGDGLLILSLDQSNCVEEYERVQSNGGTVPGGSSHQKSAFVDPESIATFESALHAEVSAICGEPDPLAVLLMKESLAERLGSLPN